MLANLEIGGAERVTANMLRQINLEKYAIEIVVLTSRQGPLRAELPEQIPLRLIGKNKAAKATIPLILKVWTFKPDIIFVNLSYLNLLIAIIRLIFSGRQKSLLGKQASFR